MATYTPKYPYAQLGTAFNAEWLNTLNKNFDDVEADIRALIGYVDASLSEIRGDIASFKAEVRQSLADMKTYIDGQLVLIRQDFTDLKNYVDAKVTEFENLTGFVVWQEPVANYAALSTTYPRPSRGWTAQTLDDNKVYYYDGKKWIFAMQYGVGSFSAYVFIAPDSLRDKLTAIAARGV